MIDRAAGIHPGHGQPVPPIQRKRPFSSRPQHDAPEIAIAPISNQHTEYRLLAFLEPSDLLCKDARHWIPAIARQGVEASQRYLRITGSCTASAVLSTQRGWICKPVKVLGRRLAKRQRAMHISILEFLKLHNWRDIRSPKPVDARARYGVRFGEGFILNSGERTSVVVISERYRLG